MDMSKAIDVGLEIKRRLEQKNVKQNHAAKAIQISPAALNTYCSGIREANYSTLIAIAGYLGCTPNDLLGIPSAIDRDLFNDVVAQVSRFMADHKREMPADRLGALYWAIYDTATAEPETMIGPDGRINRALLTGMMRTALSF